MSDHDRKRRLRIIMDQEDLASETPLQDMTEPVTEPLPNMETPWGTV